MTGYDFHPEARFDLDEIWEFIRADNPDAADRVITEIFDTIRGLVRFPGQGHRRPDLTSGPLRFTLAREYRIAYAPRAAGTRGLVSEVLWNQRRLVTANGTPKRIYQYFLPRRGQHTTPISQQNHWVRSETPDLPLLSPGRSGRRKWAKNGPPA